MKIKINKIKLTSIIFLTGIITLQTGCIEKKYESDSLNGTVWKGLDFQEESLSTLTFQESTFTITTIAVKPSCEEDKTGTATGTYYFNNPKLKIFTSELSVDFEISRKEMNLKSLTRHGGPMVANTYTKQ